MPGSTTIIVENLSVPFDRRVWQEARALAAAGWDTRVVCPTGETQDRAPYEERDGVRIFRYDLAAGSGSLGGYPKEYSSAILQTIRQLRGEAGGADVYHLCNPPDLLFLSVLGAKARGAQILFDQHDLVPELWLSRFGGRKGLGYWATRAAERMTYAAADWVVAMNDSYREVALQRSRLDPDRVVTVRTAPDLTRFAGGKPDERLKGGAGHLLVYLGVMGPQDGVDYALQALTHVESTDWHAVFIGDGDARPAMEALMAELGLSDRVTFTGRISDEDLLDYLATADLCLSPDPSSPLNNVSTMNKVLEYMAAGKPMVSFDLKEARISAGEAAVYVPANDVASFGREVSRLIAAPKERGERGSTGRGRIEGPLSWTTSKENLLGLYARIDSAIKR